MANSPNVNNITKNYSNPLEQFPIKYEKQKQQKFKHWLCNIVKLPQYLPIFVNNEYNDITMIEYIDENVITNELKISKQPHIQLLLTHINKFKHMRHEFNTLFTQNKTLKPFKQQLIKNGILTIHNLKQCIKTHEDIKQILEINNQQQMQQILAIIHMQTTENPSTIITTASTTSTFDYTVSELWKYRQLFLKSNPQIINDFNDLIIDDENFHEINAISISNKQIVFNEINTVSNARYETDRILIQMSEPQPQPQTLIKHNYKKDNDFVRGMNIGLFRNKTQRMHQNKTENWEYRKVSQYTGFMLNNKKQIQLFTELPDWICNGFIKNGIHKFNTLQTKIMTDLCLGNDNIIISSVETGKTIGIIMSSFYRLYIKKAPAHIIFITVDHIHVQILKQLCLKFGEFVPDLNIIEQFRGSKYIRNNRFNEGRNIFICTPGKAINLCENAGYGLIDNLVCVTVFDSDTLLINPLIHKLLSTFKWIPRNINVNFVACSMCNEMEVNMKPLIDIKCVKRFIFNDYNNLQFWYKNCGQKYLRLEILNELCKMNPYKKGVIFCSLPYQAKIVKESLDFKCEIFAVDKLPKLNDLNEIINKCNNGLIEYIITHEYSPIHMLYKLNEELGKVIINFEMKSCSSYLKRACIGKYGSCEKKIHFISIIDDESKEIYDKIEEECKIKIIELPSNIGNVLCDNDDSKTDNKINSYGDGDKVQKMKGFMDEYMVSGVMDEILDFGSKINDFKVWASVINDGLRDRKSTEINDFIELILILFKEKILHNKSGDFVNVVIKYLTITLDDNCVDCPNFSKYVAILFANLCYNGCLNPDPCYSYFIKKYKEYSEYTLVGKKEMINKIIKFSVDELNKLQASYSMINIVEKKRI